MVYSKDLGQPPKRGPAQKDNKETSALLHIERLETALFNISSAITAHEDLNKILELIARECLNCLRANRSTIFLIDPKTRNLKPHSTHALDPLDERVGLFEEREVAQKAFELKKPFLLGGRGKSEELSKGREQERRIISLMSFPLVPRGDPVGVASLVLINEENGFDENNMQVFSSFANLASIAMEMSNFPEGVQTGIGMHHPSDRGTENIPEQPPSPLMKESQRVDAPHVKIRAEQNAAEIPDLPQGLHKGKGMRMPSEPRAESIPDHLPSPPAKESRRADIPLVKIKAESKVEGKKGIEPLSKEKAFRSPSARYTESIPDQPPSPPPKESQRPDEPILKKKAEQKLEEPRVIEGPNKEKIAWAPGTVSLKEEAGIERRMEERVETTVRAEFQEEYWGVTKNLSKGGAFIVTSTPLDLGDEIVLRLHLPDGQEELELDCKVVWTNQYGRETQDLRRGMGVKFLNLQPEAQKRIHSYIEFQKNRNLRLER